jgi:hypothetical protein
LFLLGSCFIFSSSSQTISSRIFLGCHNILPYFVLLSKL